LRDNARRRAEVAAQLVGQVFPVLPVRPWVPSIPKRLRYLLQRDPAGRRAVLLQFGTCAHAIRPAAPKSEAERQEMIVAEQEGKRRAKEEYPALTKAWPDSATP
jgi:hypothetical protein